jgi:peptide/nickel transport system permease protein
VVGAATLMLTFIARRLAATVGLLIVVSFITFVIFFVVPEWAGQTPYQLALAYVGRGASVKDVTMIETRLGLNQPFFPHYYDYVKAMFVGTNYFDGTQTVHCSAPCFGYSFRTNAEVWPTVLGVFPVTLSIAAGAAVLWLVFGVASGVVSAVLKGSIWDRASMFVSLLGVSLPIYFIAPMVMLVLCYHWSVLQPPTYVGILQNPGSWASNMILPWTTLAFGYAALYTRLTRAGMLDALNEDFTRTARAKGLSERKVIGKHALRAAVTPIITIFGMDVGALLGGAVLAEEAFSMHGVGQLALTAINEQDFPMIMGVTLFAAFFVILANLVVDVGYAALDPRVRLA